MTTALLDSAEEETKVYGRAAYQGPPGLESGASLTALSQPLIYYLPQSSTHFQDGNHSKTKTSLCLRAFLVGIRSMMDPEKSRLTKMCTVVAECQKIGRPPNLTTLFYYGALSNNSDSYEYVDLHTLIRASTIRANKIKDLQLSK